MTVYKFSEKIGDTSENVFKIHENDGKYEFIIEKRSKADKNTSLRSWCYFEEYYQELYDEIVKTTEPEEIEKFLEFKKDNDYQLKKYYEVQEHKKTLSQSKEIYYIEGRALDGRFVDSDEKVNASRMIESYEMIEADGIIIDSEPEYYANSQDVGTGVLLFYKGFSEFLERHKEELPFDAIRKKLIEITIKDIENTISCDLKYFLWKKVLGLCDNYPLEISPESL